MLGRATYLTVEAMLTSIRATIERIFCVGYFENRCYEQSVLFKGQFSLSQTNLRAGTWCIPGKAFNGPIYEES